MTTCIVACDRCHWPACLSDRQVAVHCRHRVCDQSSFWKSIRPGLAIVSTRDQAGRRMDRCCLGRRVRSDPRLSPSGAGSSGLILGGDSAMVGEARHLCECRSVARHGVHVAVFAPSGRASRAPSSAKKSRAMALRYVPLALAARELVEAPISALRSPPTTSRSLLGVALIAAEVRATMSRHASRQAHGGTKEARHACTHSALCGTAAIKYLSLSV